MGSTRTTFLWKFLREPRKIGSVVPSSAFLTRKMFARLPWENAQTIVELGAGTGVFTRHIVKHKSPSARLLVMEQDHDMREALRTRLPEINFGSNAEKLDDCLAEHNMPQADYIVSGLPFAAFTDELRESIMSAVVRSLKPGGMFVQFQYSLQMRAALRQKFHHISIGFVPLNVPPAFVYYCQK